MSAVSYKEMLTNMLIVFINQRVQESKDIQDKVDTLDKEKKKKFHKKVVEFVISKAKGLAELQGTQYLGVQDDTVVNWINDFFDEFEENMKEPEKPKTTAIQKSLTSGISKTSGSSNFKVEDGLFGLEISIDKKTKVNKEEFIKKMKELYKDEVVEFEWKEDEVIVKHHKTGETNETVEENDEENEDENLPEEDEVEDDEEEVEDDEEEVEEKPVVKEVKTKKEKVVKEEKPKKEKVAKEEKPKVEEPAEEDTGLFDL